MRKGWVVLLLAVALSLFLGVSVFGSVNQLDVERALVIEVPMLPMSEKITAETMEEVSVNGVYAEAVVINIVFPFRPFDEAFGRGVRLKYPLGRVSMEGFRAFPLDLV